MQGKVPRLTLQFDSHSQFLATFKLLCPGRKDFLHIVSLTFFPDRFGMFPFSFLTVIEPLSN